jgi:sugar/nucleoside kinase (ribokinase family)
VTLGARGALAAAGDRVLHAEGHDVEVVDTTGAGDLFAAAWIWADLAGEDLRARLEWATLYAARSVGALTGVGGALTREELTRAKELS